MDWTAITAFAGALVGVVGGYFSARALEAKRVDREDRYRFSSDKSEAYLNYLRATAAFIRDSAAFMAWRGTVRDGMNSGQVAHEVGVPWADLADEELTHEDIFVLAEAGDLGLTTTRVDAPSLADVTSAFLELELLAPPPVLRRAKALFASVVRLRLSTDDPDALRPQVPSGRRFSDVVRLATLERERFRGHARADIGASGGAPLSPPEEPPSPEASQQGATVINCRFCGETIEDPTQGEIRFYEERRRPGDGALRRWKFAIAHKPGVRECGQTEWTDAYAVPNVELADYLGDETRISRLIDRWVSETPQVYCIADDGTAEDVLEAIAPRGITAAMARRLYRAKCH